ncbi:MAG: PAS domain S-box protein [Myxococcales bacterium]|nr:PAS domain S-box protein [Myxococcales bacterium]
MATQDTSTSNLPLPCVFELLVEAADAAAMAAVVARVSGDDLTLVYANQGTERMLGWDFAELQARALWDFVDATERPRLRDIHARRMRGESVPSVVETLLIRRDRTRVPVEISVALTSLEGAPALVAFAFDISYRRKAEAALRSSEKRFRSLIENAPDGVAILHWPEILFLNPEAARLLGYAHPDLAVGRDLREKLRPAEAAEADERVQQLVAHGRPQQPQQYHSTDIEGRERTVEISSIPIEYESQEAVLAFARDVTVRNIMAGRLLEADKLAAVGTLAAGVAHEINNPLAYLMLNLEVLAHELPKLGGEPERLRQVEKRLTDIRQGAERVKAIVHDLQTLTRKDEDIRGPVDLPVVLDAAIHMAQHEIRPRARLATRFIDVPPVYGNVTRLEQLFVNLLVNAAHALADGDPEHDSIEVILARPDDRVAVEVRDTGCGMTETVRKKAFEPFFTTKAPGVGTGLGLPICRGIVEALGGEIHLVSKPDEGTTVRVLLRTAGDEAPAVVADSMPAVSRLTPNAPPGRILLVDDDTAVAESLAYAIRECHEVVVVHSAKEARRALAEEAFDAILCDLVMPEETGMELYERVRRQDPAIARRFIFMTGGAFLPETETFLQGNQNRRIDKPFELSELGQLLDDVLCQESE